MTASITSIFTKRNPSLANHLTTRDHYFREHKLNEMISVLGEPRLNSFDGSGQIDRQREALLTQFRTEWAAGNTRDKDAADWFYAIYLLHAERGMYAGLAERETAEFLRQMAAFGRKPGASDLIELTHDKPVNEDGPDGLFLGAAELLGLPADKYIGVEVKTVLAGSNLSERISNLKSSLKPRKKAAADPHGYRKKSADEATEKLETLIKECLSNSEKAKFFAANMKITVPELMRRAKTWQGQIAEHGDKKFATLLVVRHLSLDKINSLPDFAKKAFDVVLTFDIWHRLEANATVLPSAGHFTRIDRAAHDFNFERLKALADRWHMPVELLYPDKAA